MSWLDISDWLRSQNGLDAIEARLRAGDYYGVVQGVEDAARRFATETHSGFVTAGRAGSEWLDSQLPDKLVRFDVTNQRAIYQAKQNELELVHGLTQETRQTVHQILVDGTARSENPRVMARSIRDSIGLAPNQEAAVRSYRAALEQGDWSNALGRELSSGHSDRTIRRAQAGGSLSQEQIDTAVERYRTNAVHWRAETIARTEASRNVHSGIHESLIQAVERGDIAAIEVRREWIHAGRGIHSRSSHSALDGTTVGLNEQFHVSGVEMRWPGDPNAPASETANCRCTIAVTLAG